MKNRKGMTLIEVIISIMLLSIISIAILPISAYSVRFAKWNNIKLNALNLAYSQVEWLKTLNYEDLGLAIDDYSPKGIINPSHYVGNSDSVNIDGVEYTLNTSIYWESATSATGEPVAQAMKKIDVTVDAKDVNSGLQREYAVLGTLISREGERNPTKPGHVVVRVYLRSGGEPVKNIRVGFGKRENLTYSAYTNTDEKGEALFGDLDQGNYKIEPTKWKYTPLMVMPNGTHDHKDWKRNKEVTIPKWDKDKKDEIKYPEESFIIDFPGRIEILDNSQYPKDTTIMIAPTGESYIPTEGEDENYMKLATTVGDIGDIDFWRLWNYEFTLAKGSEEFFLEKIGTNKLWDGKFDMSKLNEESLVKVDMKFGIKDGKINGDIDDPTNPIEFIINFSSNINNYQDIEFEINQVPIDKESYVISRPHANNHQIIISFQPEIVETATEDLEFKISNYEQITNSYGMNLAQDKRTILITN